MVMMEMVVIVDIRGYIIMMVIYGSNLMRILMEKQLVFGQEIQFLCLIIDQLLPLGHR